MSFLALGVGLAAIGCGIVGLGMALTTGKACEAVARQPEASGKINTMLLLGLALSESCAIYAFVTGLIMIFTL